MLAPHISYMRLAQNLTNIHVALTHLNMEADKTKICVVCCSMIALKDVVMSVQIL